MQLSLGLFKESKKFYPQSKAWIKSSEFKEKYLDAHHPYPPLLNPQNIDYESISADLAWELNLPLPPNYDFMYVTNGSSASEATYRFLEKCNVKTTHTTMIDYSPKGIFLSHFNIFKYKKSKNIFSGYTGGLLTNLDSNYVAYRFSKSVPLLYIARDPIEKIQHAINHIIGEGYMGNKATLNLTCNYIKLAFTRQLYEGNMPLPSIEALQNLSLIKMWKYYKFAFDSLLNTFKDKISSIHCIEFNDLKPDKAFDTFCKLADALGFEKPTNKEIFTNRVNRNRGALITLPTTLYAHPDDLPNTFKEGQEEKRNLDSLNKKGGFSVIVTLPHYVTDEQKDFADISDEIYPNLIIDDTRILIIIDKDELVQLKENTELFNATKTYLKGYLNALIDNANKIKANLITESQILEYLRSNDEVRKNIKRILDSELNYIKTHHPDFIQKWKYYLEFEKMCAELDDENLNGRQK